VQKEITKRNGLWTLPWTLEHEKKCHISAPSVDITASHVMVAAKNSLRSAKTSRTSSNRVRLGLKLPSSSLRVTPGADERRPQPLLARSVNLWHFGFRSVAVLGLGSPGKRLWKPKKGIALESEAPIHRQGESKVRQAASSQRVGE